MVTDAPDWFRGMSGDDWFLLLLAAGWLGYCAWHAWDRYGPVRREPRGFDVIVPRRRGSGERRR